MCFCHCSDEEDPNNNANDSWSEEKSEDELPYQDVMVNVPQHLRTPENLRKIFMEYNDIKE